MQRASTLGDTNTRWRRRDKDEQPVAFVECFTADMARMAEWLISRGVRSVAM